MGRSAFTSESDGGDGDNRNWEMPNSRAAARRRKHDELSPSEQFAQNKRQQTRLDNNNTTVSYASRASAVAPPQHSAAFPPTRTNQVNYRRRPIANVIKGSANSSILRAASPKPNAEKSVVCISNVSTSLAAEDIIQHCKSLNIKSFFCYDVSKSGYSGKAFKLAFDAIDLPRVLSAESWPLRVTVRPWRAGRPPSVVSTGSTIRPNLRSDSTPSNVTNPLTTNSAMSVDTSDNLLNPSEDRLFVTPNQENIPPSIADTISSPQPFCDGGHPLDPPTSNSTAVTTSVNTE